LVVCWKTSDVELVLDSSFFFLVTGPTRKKMREKEASLEKYKKGTG
jgi:preprotein translocase subunit YajC